MLLPLSAWLFLLSVHQGACNGCMWKVCDGNDNNDLRRCPDRDRSCGTYNGQRSDKRLMDAVDIRCDKGKSVHAPIDGVLEFWRPFGGKKEKKCADSGVKIEGTGNWEGYVVYISSLELDRFGGAVKRGDEIGRAVDRVCNEDETQKLVEPHVQLRVTKGGEVVDPTHHLQNCRCTGSICEGNVANSLVGDDFKSDSRYNGVKGWDIECRKIEEKSIERDADGSFYEKTELRAPTIYSPIAGEVFGRSRVHFDGDNAYSGCDNDAVFIVGHEEWNDFEVRIYNVRYRQDLGAGRMKITQNYPIGTRLNCTNSPDSIFMEVRHRGRLVDISDLISATNCAMPNLVAK